MVAETHASGSSPRPPAIVWLGLGVVLVAVAVLSFGQLRQLALAVRIAPEIAPLWPVAVDAGCAVSTAVWIGGRSPHSAVRFARPLTLGLLATTVAANAIGQGMAAAGITPPWPVAVAVGAVPPLVVGSVVHLVVLLGRGAGPGVHPAQIVDQQFPATAEDQRGPGSVQTPFALGRTPSATVGPNATVETVDELLPAVRDWIAAHPATPSQRQLRAEFGVGAERARKLMEAAA